MAIESDEIISVLNNLIETCKDGEQGFRDAAEGTHSGELKSLFSSSAQQRSQFCNELEGEVRRLGGDPDDHGSLSGTIHRGWLNLKDVFTGDDDKAIVAECERGEDAAVERYQDALEEPLPGELQSLIHRQFVQVKEAHDRIRDLKQTMGTNL